MTVGLLQPPEDISSSNNNTSTKSRNTESRPRAGENAELYMNDSTTLLVAPTKELYDLLNDLGHSQNIKGIDQLRAQNKVWAVYAGTSCLVIEHGLLSYKIEILDGLRKGQTCYVLPELVFQPRKKKEISHESSTSKNTNIKTKTAPTKPRWPSKPDPRINKMLDQLNTFKHTTNFKKYGFGIGGPYNSWLVKIKQMYADKSLHIETQIAAGNLMMYGMEYIKKSRSAKDQEIHLGYLMEYYDHKYDDDKN